MKLYLSSYRVPTPDDFVELIGKPAGTIRLAMIPNAKDAYVERIWTMKNNDVVRFFASIGITDVTIVDLRDYSDGLQLKDYLAEYDVIWANGGNTFLLRYAMRVSGFDTIITDLLASGIVYGGESAGLLVAGPTLHGSEVADEAEFAPEIVWDGLGLVTDMIWPHADEAMYADALRGMRQLYPGMLELKNSQAVVIDGHKRRIVENGSNKGNL